MVRGIIKNLILGGIVVMIALAAAEVFLRLTVAQEMIFDTWFTPGIHVPDEKFGFAFAGNYRGYMRHRDRVWNVPLHLDEHGFRLPNYSGEPGPRRYVVVIGGRSAMMSYGLPDDKTVTGKIAANSRYNLEVRNTAWPGFDLYRNWHIYRDRLGGSEHLDVAIIGIYGKRPQSFAGFPDDFEAVPPPPSRFRLQSVLGSDHYRSFVAHGALRMIDRLLERKKESEPRVPHKSGKPVHALNDIERLGLDRFSEFLSYLEQRFSRRDTKMMVAFMPRTGTPQSFYDALSEAVPDGIPWVDLHRDLARQIRQDGFIADGHYGAEQADLIGNRLAREVDKLLDESE